MIHLGYIIMYEYLLKQCHITDDTLYYSTSTAGGVGHLRSRPCLPGKVCKHKIKSNTGDSLRLYYHV